MAPLKLRREIMPDHFKSNFARPQALLEVSSGKSSTSFHLTPRKIAILIDIILVVVICFLLLVGYCLYRRQLKRKLTLTESVTPIDSRCPSNPRDPDNDRYPKAPPTFVIEKEWLKGLNLVHQVSLRQETRRNQSSYLFGDVSPRRVIYFLSKADFQKINF